ncbi:MAG: DUF21 domain-containing protein [Alphaproteobacteria bacterium]|nr:DUF21 domain-containing protein [Alphaproteobacteria bacterium]
MLLLIIYASLAIGISFLCSVMEAALLSIVPSYVAQLEETNPKLFKKVSLLKAKIDRPLAAILSLNTVAHTVGATGVGAQVTEIFGQAYIGWASGIMTFLILVLSEILPKSIGTKYWKQLIPSMVVILHIMIAIMLPFIWLSGSITRWFTSDNNDAANIPNEIRALARMAQASNVLNEARTRTISNVVRLDEIKIKDIMTPRTVVHVVRPGMSIEEFDKFLKETPFSRFPIVDELEKTFLGYIHKSSSYNAKDDDIVDTYARQMCGFSPDAEIEDVLNSMLKDHKHMVLVIDQFGNWQGIVTLEDIIETILGAEIVDETDTIADMQQYAKQKWQKKRELKGIVLSQEFEE